MSGDTSAVVEPDGERATGEDFDRRSIVAHDRRLELVAGRRIGRDEHRRVPPPLGRHS
jgi:hypothetical protein